LDSYVECINMAKVVYLVVKAGFYRIIAKISVFSVISELKGQVEHSLCLVVQRGNKPLLAAHLGSRGPLGLDRRAGCGKAVVGVAEKDQLQDGDGVLSGTQARVGAQPVGCIPQSIFELVVTG
jgi:hypothetical protein